ncbi:orotidine-5'-phosphate decarboxylase [Mariprofundus ferrinatatus]|uniref:Orotidine 5'-phosphate decarboxylase n=1 Tax=Mariprofundus ferrinatatus TaxID=1921087 RepID=A0A2K8L292_9PROT|nr:orotidine-5'-phosphate decarboxylase [Mariprofundus ferrinatatus]ATX81450.1 orotidine-5'-phosphate decarboxylase [Mariprofundus ferrinatatus]
MRDRSMQQRLMVALDVDSRKKALAMRDAVGDSVGWLKVGLRLFVAEGPDLVRELKWGHKLFLDLKFHDIPNTVAQAIESAGSLGVDMVNVHAGGGEEMLAAAANAAKAFPNMKLIAVTVLTSDPMPKEQAREVALMRARMAQQAGLDGVVCSVHEAAAIKELCGNDFITVTPGIRWGGQDVQDQKRIADPASAIANGSDYLVVGRPILQAPDPAAAADEAVKMMESVAT